MSLALYRLGRLAFRRKWWFVAAWLAVLVAAGSLVGALQPSFASDFELPGTDSDRAMTVLREEFPAANEQQTEASTSIVIAADDGLRAHTEQIDALVSAARTLPDVVDVQSIANPVTLAQTNPALADSVLGDGGRVGLIQIRQNIPAEDLTAADKEQFEELLAEHRGNGLDVEGTGSLLQVMEAGGAAELLGFAVAFVVMIVAFGALIAAFIPIVTALVGVGITILLVTLSALVVDIQSSATAIITMLGIAVSIDYALFIVSRYRSELNERGTREEAAGRAVGTAGSAVVFAGLTVMVAVAALAVVGIPFVTQMGVAAAVAILVAVLGAITLIPALLGVVGRRAFSPAIPGLRQGDESDDQPSNGMRVARLIARHPIATAVLGLATLVVAALPMANLELGLDTTTDAEYAATQMLKRGFGEGVNGPLLVTVDVAPGTDVAPAADAVIDRIKTLDDVATPEQLRWIGNNTVPGQPQQLSNAALISVTPEQSPSGEATHDLMEHIRDFGATSPGGAQVHVGGQTAIMSDISAKLSSSLLPFLILVVGLAFLILMIVFRSILVPLIATVGFLFSVCATFGAAVFVFQQGHLGLVDRPMALNSFIPIFLVGVVFGLAMDYQVFLVTRMREEHVHGRAPKEAMIVGYQHGARVVASAALIMISVFVAFMLAPDSFARMMGFALAAAVFFDAFIVRMLVVPAVIVVLGERAWALPSWLDRILPDVDVEGTAIRRLVPTAVPDDSSATFSTAPSTGVHDDH